MSTAPPVFMFEKWRHGGWYVTNIRYPSGACGCVSNNYADKKWRIACDPRPFETAPTFRTREEAARAEWEMVQAMSKPAAPDIRSFLARFRDECRDAYQTGRIPPDLYVEAGNLLAELGGGAS